MSSQSIVAGAGYAQATVDVTTTKVMFGLSSGNSSASYTDIDFAWDLVAGTLAIYEAGSYKGSFGSYAAGDVLRVSVAGGVVKYYRNGVLKYTSAGTPTYPLGLDTSIYTPGAKLLNAQIASSSLP